MRLRSMTTKTTAATGIALTCASLLLAGCSSDTNTESRAAAPAEVTQSTAVVEPSASSSGEPAKAWFGRNTRACIINESSWRLHANWEEPYYDSVFLGPGGTSCDQNTKAMGEEIVVYLKQEHSKFHLLAEADNPSVGKPDAAISTVTTKTNGEKASVKCLSKKFDVNDRWSWDSGVVAVTMTRLPDTKKNVEFTFVITDSTNPSKDGNSALC